MNYVNKAGIKALREQCGLTQRELAERIGVSDKAVSKWETGRGLPDISTLSILADALGVSLAELFAGEKTINQNKSSNMLKSRFYVCPICGNVMHSMGCVSLSCCGVELPPLEPESPDAEHEPIIELVENEYYVHLPHPMSRSHHISFLAYVNWERLQLVKLYPEQDAAVRFARCGKGILYLYCQKHGLYAKRL